MLALEFPGIIISLLVYSEGNKVSKDQDERTEIGWHIPLPHLPVHYSTMCTDTTIPAYSFLDMNIVELSLSLFLNLALRYLCLFIMS